MDDQLILEEFHAAHGKAGVLMRRVGERELDTTMIVKLGAEPMRLMQRTVFRHGRGGDWASFDYSDGATSIHGECDERGHVSVQGLPSPELTGAVPSYAAYRVVECFIATEEPSLRFREFSEAGGDVWESLLVRAGDDEIILPGGIRTHAHRIELHRGGTVTTTFWVQGVQVVASDWNGPRSYLVDTPEDLWSGLDDDVITHIDAFLLQDRPGRADDPFEGARAC